MEQQPTTETIPSVVTQLIEEGITDRHEQAEYLLGDLGDLMVNSALDAPEPKVANSEAWICDQWTIEAGLKSLGFTRTELEVYRHSFQALLDYGSHPGEGYLKAE